MSTRYAGMLFPRFPRPGSQWASQLRSVDLNEGLVNKWPADSPAEDVCKLDFWTLSDCGIKQANALFSLDGCNNRNMRAVFMLCRIWGCLVDKELCYKPGGRGFETRLSNPSGRTRPWGLLSLWQKWVPEAEKVIFLGSRARPVHKADNLTTICEPIANTIFSLTSHSCLLRV
jgi:hypothetical protein